MGHYEGISYTTTADHLAQVERFYSMAAMAKLERCPDCIAAGAPPDAAQVTPIPGCGPSSQGSVRQIRFFCQRCGGLHTSVTTIELPSFPELDQVLRPQSFQEWHPPLAVSEPEDILCGAVTMDDLEALLSRLPTRSAPGPSQVTYSFLKHAPRLRSTSC